MRLCLAGLCMAVVVSAQQEAPSGFDLRTTVTAQTIVSDQLEAPPRDGSIATPGFRAMLYPTWKLSQNWSFTGAVQILSRPFYLEQYRTQGSGIRGDILQGHLDYSRIRNSGSMTFRVGQLSSAFGSFLLRYDDNDNPLTDMPLSYGYYYKGVTSYGMPGAQLDLTSHKFDGRVQFVNSSPANRRGIADGDQYGNWTGGIGYTIVQGLRIGASAYRGPYLHRQFAYFLPGEANPKDLPATAVGIDVSWARGHWSTNGELHWFTLPYRAMPTVKEQAGYVEARRTLHPRWFVATRLGYMHYSFGQTAQNYEFAAGFRPNSHQLIKCEYQTPRGPSVYNSLGRALVVQLVTSFHPISIARD